LHPKRSHCTPPALPAGRASSLIPPPSRLVVFAGWLLCVLASFGDLFRPRCIFFFCYLSINSTAGTMTWRHPTRSAQVGSLPFSFQYDFAKLQHDHVELRHCRFFQPSCELLSMIWEILLTRNSPDLNKVRLLKQNGLGKLSI